MKIFFLFQGENQNTDKEANGNCDCKYSNVEDGILDPDRGMKISLQYRDNGKVQSVYDGAHVSQSYSEFAVICELPQKLEQGIAYGNQHKVTVIDQNPPHFLDNEMFRQKGEKTSQSNPFV